jgi:AraC family transcriptional regulator
LGHDDLARSDKWNPAVARANEFDEILSYIEKNLSESLSVASIASAARLSPYHFSRMFTAHMGDSVMSYVRGRRMTHAAQRLASETPPALAELSFDCGFESQEAFTRAFARTFGVTPGRFRREHLNQRREMESDMTDRDGKPNLVPIKDIVHRSAFIVAGVGGRIEQANKHMIPTLWPKLFQRLAADKRKDWRTYGVCWAADDSEDGAMNYMAAVEVEAGTKPPAGLETMTIPEQSYLAYRLTIDGSDLHTQMQAAAKEIWGECIGKSGKKLAKGPDLEVYPADFDPSRPGATVDFWVPVEGR